MSFEAVSRYEGRFELWSACAGMAWMVRDPTGPDHESPASRLAGMAALIAAVRGAPIECYGSMDLLPRDGRGRANEIMQADQTVYLDPSRARLAGALAPGDGGARAGFRLHGESGHRLDMLISKPWTLKPTPSSAPCWRSASGSAGS